MIEGDLRPNREKVDNFLGVSRLLKRLEFLFELPGRLERSISLGAFEEAVKYFNTSSRIFSNYKNMQSFTNIQLKSEAIMDGLKKQLREAILKQQPLPGASGASGASGAGAVAVAGAVLSSERQMSYVAMLVCDLRESESSSKELLGHVLALQRAKSTQGMQRALDLAAVASAHTNAARKASIDLNAAPSAAAAAAATAASSSSSSSSSSSASVASGPSLLSLLQQHFLNPFILFADTFLDTLVRPYEASLKKLKLQQSAAIAAGAGAGAGAGAATATTDRFSDDIQHLTRSLALTNSSLLSLTSDLFAAYFNLVRTELLRFATIRPVRGAGALASGVGASAGLNGGDEDAARAILNFTGALKDFYSSLSRPMSLVPRAGLEDRATELMQKAILGCVENICDKVLWNVVQALSDIHTQAVEFSSSGGASSSQQQQMVLPSPAALSTTVRKSIEEGVSLLVVVLSTREYLPASLPFPTSGFNDLAHAHFHQLLTQLLHILKYRTPSRADGPIFDALPQTKLSTTINDKISASAAAAAGGAAGGRFTIRDAHAPLFYLYLSQICSAQESKDIPASLKTLRKFFPLPTVAPSSSSGRSGSGGRLSQQQQQQADREAFLQDLLAQTKDNAQALLLRFSETHGFIASNIVRVHMVSDTTTHAHTATPSARLALHDHPLMLHKVTPIAVTDFFL